MGLFRRVRGGRLWGFFYIDSFVCWLGFFFCATSYTGSEGKKDLICMTSSTITICDRTGGVLAYLVATAYSYCDS